VSIAAFVASGARATFRSPYISLSDSPINMNMKMAELTKARFILACIRHTWDTYIKGEFPDEMLAVLSRIIDDEQPIDLAAYRAHIDRFQVVFDREKAIANADATHQPKAIMMYLVGAVAGWFFHAFAAVEEDASTDWFRYSVGNSRWLPLWHVLDGCASVGGSAERTWQEEAIVHFVEG
jgi:hypothetical protein